MHQLPLHSGRTLCLETDEKGLTALSAKLGLHDTVTWNGQVSGEEKWDFFRQADIFCFPTFYRTEGFPVVLLEAMMFGLPVVSTTWRGIPDMVEDGESGFLVPTQNPRAVADRLGQLIRDPELRNSMGSVGRKRYEEKFTVEKFRLRMEEVLSNV